ncbi:hypothetical protein FGO68_gene15223 [Halteria grandinella]|uniref:Uncharacterized protein n=1 Tax=Halteria grandinella TaxID=5974 RepID=A0A8J8P4Z5_HALGN|nr:hypothetical protein FGO68_gene15223 [Halteria grandinella]
MDLVYMDLLQTDLWISNIIDLESSDDDALCPSFKIAGYNSQYTISNLGSTFIFLFLLLAYQAILLITKAFTFVFPIKWQVLMLFTVYQGQKIILEGHRSALLEHSHEICHSAILGDPSFKPCVHKANLQELPLHLISITKQCFHYSREDKWLFGSFTFCGKHISSNDYGEGYLFPLESWYINDLLVSIKLRYST